MTKDWKGKEYPQLELICIGFENDKAVYAHIDSKEAWAALQGYEVGLKDGAAARGALLDALIALRDAVKAGFQMQGREYVQLGIQVNDAIRAAESSEQKP